jgi:hypothetical protein
MPDWQRPDWRNEQAYAHIATAPKEQLAWEYLRRDQQYEKDWREDPRSAMDWIDEIPVTLPDADELNKYLHLCQHYMVREMFRPSASPPEVVFLPFCPQWEQYGGGSCQNDITLRSPSEVVIKFYLGSTLNRQIEAAEDLLKSLRKESEDKEEKSEGTKRAPEREDIRKHLRLLDARHHKVKWQVVYDELFPGLSPAYVPGKAKRLMKTAKELCRWKYKLLLLGCYDTP